MKALFASIARRYDRMNRIMSLALDRRWRRKALDAVKIPSSGACVLDLACGTGDFTIELLRKFPSIKVTGADITPEMIEIAKAKLAGQESVHFVVADAQNLSVFDAETFALAVCAFGFRNFPDKRKALAECHRVLRQSGELVVLEFFRPENKVLGLMVNAWLAIIACLFCGRKNREYAYLRKSVSDTVSIAEFSTMARDAGFDVANVRSMFPSATALLLRKRHAGTS